MKDNNTLKYQLGYSGLFASRKSVGEAMDYVSTIGRACGKGNELAVTTAAMVLMNTYIESLLKEYIILPRCENQSQDGLARMLGDEGIQHFLRLPVTDDKVFTRYGDKTAEGLYRSVLRKLEEFYIETLEQPK